MNGFENCSEQELAFLRSLTPEQCETLRQAHAPRTIADMPADQFMQAQAEVTAGAIRTALTGLGAGRVDRSGLIPASAENAGGEAQPTEREQRVAGMRLSLQHHPDIRGLSVADQDVKIRGYLQVGQWVQAMVAGDQARADLITAESYMDAGVNIRQISSDPASAGSLIPLPLQGPIIEQRELADKITPRASQYRSDSGQVQASVEGTQLVAQGVAENADSSAGAADPTYDPITLVKKKAVVYATSSREVLFDAAASMQLTQNLSRQAGRKLGAYNNDQNINGDGVTTSYTDGILNNAGIAAPVGSGGAASRAKVQALIYAMEPDYWDNLVWLIDPNTLAILAALQDPTSGQYIYPNLNVNQTQVVSGDAPGIGFGGIENLPAVILPNSVMAGILVLANLDFFGSLVEDGIRVETTNVGGDTFKNDQQAWKFVQRQDGAVLLTDGFVKTDAAVS